MTLSSLTFTGCGKDYDDDLKNLKEEIETNKADLNKLLADYKTLIDYQLSLMDEARKNGDATLQTQIDKIVADLKDVKAMAEKNAAAISELKLTTSELTTSLNSFKELVNNSLSGINSKITTLESDLKALDSKYDGKINALDSRITANETAIAGMKDQAALLDKAIKALEEKTGKTDAAVADMKLKLVELQDQIKANEAALAAYKESVANQFKGVDDKFAALTEAFDGKLANLVLDYKNADQQLSDQIANATAAQTAALNAYKETMAAYQESVKAQFATVTAEILANKTAIGQLTTQYGQLVALYASLNDKYIALEKTAKELQDADIALNAKIIEMGTNIENLDKKLSKEISDLRDAMKFADAGLSAEILKNGEAILANSGLIADNSALIIKNGELIVANKTAIGKVETKLGRFTTELLDSILAHRNEIDALGSKINGLNSKMLDSIANIRTAISEMDTKLNGRMDEMERNALKQSDLDAILSDAKTYADSLYNELTTTTSQLATDIETVNRRVDDIVKTIAGLQNRIQSITFIANESFEGLVNVAVLHIVNRRATMKVSYRIASSSPTIVADIIKGYTAQTTKIDVLVNETEIDMNNTRSLIENPFTITSITAGKAAGVLDIELACSDTEKLGSFVGSGIPDEPSYNISYLSVAINISDKVNNIDSNFTNIVTVNTSKMLEGDLTIEFANGKGEFVKSQADAIAQTPAAENSFEMENGVVELADSVIAKCIDIVDPEFIMIKNLGIVSVYDEDGVEMKGHNFALDANTFQLTTTNQAYLGNSYKIVISAQAYDVVADTNFGAQQFSTIKVTVKATVNPTLVAGRLAGQQITLIDNAGYYNIEKNFIIVTAAPSVSLAGIVTPSTFGSSYTVKYSLEQLYLQTSADNRKLVTIKGTTLDPTGVLGTSISTYDNDRWHEVRPVIKVELVNKNDNKTIETRYFGIKFQAAK